MKTPNLSSAKTAFTLIELLVVIAIIAVLAGLAFPVYQSVQNAARKTQAKNDLVQIVTAVNAFYTDYGKYPLPVGASGQDFTYGESGSTKVLFDTLRGIDPAANPRQIEFIKPPDAKDTAAPRGGMGPAGDDQFYDPWGKPYIIRMDSDYNNEVTNPYTTGAGADPLRQGVIAWSLGLDRATAGGDKKSGKANDDVISWQ